MILRFAGLLALAAGPALAQPAPTPAPPVDYSADANWLCRPGRADVCGAPYRVTSVAANGKLTETALPATPPKAKFDCFYVYPTVSTDATGNSDMTADPAELSVARIQFAPFREVCRTYAPLYRQVTLAALRAVLMGVPTDADRMLAYRDVSAAWADYLKRDNRGRGVVLIGHSQGSGILKSLVAQEIEGKPVARQVIASYLLGINVLVPPGRDSGGDLKQTPLCRDKAQYGCVVTYVSFRDETVPPADSRFGRSADAASEVACTNPAALFGGRSKLKPLLPARSTLVAEAAAQPVWAKGATITSDFVRLPGLLSAECRKAGGASYLAIRTDGDPADPRLDTIAGDVIVAGQVQAAWGLHLIDVNAATGDLVALAASQANSWSRGGRLSWNPTGMGPRNGRVDPKLLSRP